MKSLTNIVYLSYPLLITLPNGYKVKVTQIGSVILASNIVLHKVLYVPSFRYYLVSIHCLSKSLPNSIISFTEPLCILQAPSMKRPLGIGEAKDGLQLLCSKCLRNNNYSETKCVAYTALSASSVPACIPSPSIPTYQSKSFDSSCRHKEQCHQYLIIDNTSSMNKCSCKSSVQNLVSRNKNWSHVFISLMSHASDVDLLWHNRLGHVPFVKMREIGCIPENFSTKQPCLCNICPMARQERFPFSYRTNTSTKIF